MVHGRKSLAVLAALVLAPLAVPLAVAEEEAAGPAYSLIHYDEVEPAQALAYEAWIAEWVKKFTGAEMGKDYAWWAFSSAEFSYAYMSGMPDFAFLDKSEERLAAMGEAMGEEAVKELMAGMKTVRAHHTEIVKALPELHYEPAGETPPKIGFARLGVHHVKPGHEEKFKALIQRVVADFRKAGAPVALEAYEVQFGSGTYHLVALAESAAQFYSASTTRELLTKAESAEAAAAMYEEWRGLIHDYEISDWTFRPELSYLPGYGPPPKEPEAPAGGE